MTDVLALSARPKQFKALVGQAELIKEVRGRARQGRLPKAWMFVGETGCGKTTVARIIAASLQCRHMERFGNPCEQCYRDRDKFDISEINSPVQKQKEVREMLQAADLTPSPGSRRRVYIIDEAQRMSKAAQSMMLKYLEDCPRTTNWIINTTEPEAILRALRGRCAVIQVASLDMDGVRTLVARYLKRVGSELSVAALTEKLWENGITSARLIANAVEKYVAGAQPEMAAIEIACTFDIYGLMRASMKGDWEAAGGLLRKAKAEDVRAIRRVAAHYLKSVLTGDADLSDRAAAVAKSVDSLTKTSVMEESLQLPAIISSFYWICKRFAVYKH